MRNQAPRPRWINIIRNAFILGGITMISNLTAGGGFSWSVVWAGFLAGVLVALIEIQHAYRILPTLKPNNKTQKSFFLS